MRAVWLVGVAVAGLVGCGGVEDELEQDVGLEGDDVATVEQATGRTGLPASAPVWCTNTGTFRPTACGGTGSTKFKVEVTKCSDPIFCEGGMFQHCALVQLWQSGKKIGEGYTGTYGSIEFRTARAGTANISVKVLKRSGTVAKTATVQTSDLASTLYLQVPYERSDSYQRCSTLRGKLTVKGCGRTLHGDEVRYSWLLRLTPTAGGPLDYSAAIFTYDSQADLFAFLDAYPADYKLSVLRVDLPHRYNVDYARELSYMSASRIKVVQEKNISFTSSQTPKDVNLGTFTVTDPSPTCR